MKFTENKILVFLIIGGCCLINALAQAEEQSNPSQSAQTEQVAEPTLSEQEILQFLKNKFATMQIAPDVNPAVIARIIRPQYNTIDKLEALLITVQKSAQEKADYQNNVNYWQGVNEVVSPVITRQHFSSVIHNKLQVEKAAWLVYMLLVNRRSTATHEAGHAVGVVYLLKDHRVLTEVSMIGDNLGTQAFTHATYLMHNKKTWYKDEFVQYMKHTIMMIQSGCIANQIFGFSRYTIGLTTLSNILHSIKLIDSSGDVLLDSGLQGILSGARCSSDMKSAEKLAQILIDDELTTQTKDEILQECYDLAYQFLLDHKADVEKLADLLMKKDVVFGEEVYELLGVQRPLFDFEEEIVPEVQAPPVATPTKNQKALLAAAKIKNKKNKRKK